MPPVAASKTVPELPATDRNDAVAGLGSRLRDRRLQAGLSLRQFAKRLGVSASFISQLENGKSQPSVGTLFMICNELGITVDEIFAEEGAEEEAPQVVAETPSGGVTADQPRNAHSAWSSLRTPAPGSDGPVVHPDERRRLVLDTGVTWEQLSLTHERDVEFLYVTYDVGGSSSDERLSRHSGADYGYVISGELEVTLGFETYTLRAGDSIAFDSATPHRLHNPGTEPARAIWFVRGSNASHP